MIECMNAAGTCLITDGSLTHEAYVGMTLQRTGSPCVIATNIGSNATFRINGQLVTLPPEHWLRVGPSVGKPRRFRQRESHHFRLAIGKLWAILKGDDHFDDNIDNAVIGVRG